MWCLHLHSWHLPFILTGCLFLGNEFYIVILWILTSINVSMIFMVVIKQKQLFWVVTEAALLTFNNTNVQCVCQENWWRDSSGKQSLVSNLNIHSKCWKDWELKHSPEKSWTNHNYEGASEENSSGKGKQTLRAQVKMGIPDSWFFFLVHVIFEKAVQCCCSIWCALFKTILKPFKTCVPFPSQQRTWACGWERSSWDDPG